jgi:hypothetical protein
MAMEGANRTWRENPGEITRKPRDTCRKSPKRAVTRMLLLAALGTAAKVYDLPRIQALKRF